MEKVQLAENYFIQEVSADEWYEVFSKYVPQVFPDEQSVPLDVLLNEAETAKLE